MRFVVSESTGFLTSRTGRTGRPPGSTFTVLDTLNLYRVVGLFRSEDENGYGTSARMRERAEAKAAAECDRLNEWAASA